MTLLIVALVGIAGWRFSDRLEFENDFCNACHLADGTPLHLEIREAFDRVVPRNLAGVHGRGWVESREDSEFRCVDCHAGSGIRERTHIKLLSARDGVRYLVGTFEEPEEMSFGLSAETCARCHPDFRHSAAPGWTLDAYHGEAGHDQPGEPLCVRCHAVHVEGGDPFAYFMDRSRVDEVCRSCHDSGEGSAIPSLVSSSGEDA